MIAFIFLIVMGAGRPPVPSSMSFPHKFPDPHDEHRKSIGLKPLVANSYISSVALGHCKDMLTHKTPFGHEGFNERIDLIRKHLGPLHVVAENVAEGPMSAREVVDGWLHSPGHRRNIEGDFRLTGIGVATARNGMIYFTQIFTK